MTYREKSAWIMTVALLLSGAFYAWVVWQASTAVGQLAPPFPPVIVVAVILLIAIAIVGHALAAALAPREANAPTDERDRRIGDRAGHISSLVLATGVVLSLGLYLATYEPHPLFHGAVASLVLAQVVEYGTQIYLYRAVVA